MPEPDPVIKDAENISKSARMLAESALESARLCDSEAASRLKSEAIKKLDKAKRAFNNISKVFREIPREYQPNVDAADRDIKIADELVGKVDEVIKGCVSKTYFDYEVGGKFQTPVEQADPDTPKNKIYFEFKPKGELECERHCYVSVYHIEKDDTGETLEKPSEGDTRFGAIEQQTMPRDEDAVDGYVVDTDPALPDPCWSTSETTPDGIVKSYDEPSFVKEGYTAYFETCVVCLEEGKYTIEGCQSWSYSGTDKRVNLPSKLPPSPPSEPFQRSFRHWLNKRT